MSKCKYPKHPNVKPAVGIVHIACCDCGLVHDMGFIVDDKGILTLQYSRDNRATAQLRRGNFPYLKDFQPGDKWKMVRV